MNEINTRRDKDNYISGLNYVATTAMYHFISFSAVHNCIIKISDVAESIPMKQISVAFSGHWPAENDSVHINVYRKLLQGAVLAEVIFIEARIPLTQQKVVLIRFRKVACDAVNCSDQDVNTHNSHSMMKHCEVDP